MQHARTWIVAAHPDDETIGASALLGCRDEILVVHVTNGVPRDGRWWAPGFRRRDDYVRTRDREARRALSMVGAQRIALGFDDQGTAFVLGALIETLSDLLARGRPDIVVTHAYEGGHPDHDSIAFALARARARVAPQLALYEMALYHGATGALCAGAFVGDPLCHRHDLDAEQRHRRTRMLEAYHSQREVLAPFARINHECYRPAPAYDFSRPPHRGPLLYERFGMHPKGETWRALARCHDRGGPTRAEPRAPAPRLELPGGHA